MRNKIILLVIVLIIAAAAIVFWYKTRVKQVAETKTQAPAEEVADTQTIHVEKLELSEGVVPELIPAGLISEKNVKVIENFSGKTDVDSNIATRSFQSKLSLAENEKQFKAYFESNGWKLLGGISDASHVVISAIKGEVVMQVTVTSQPEKGVVVTIEANSLNNQQ